MFIPYQSFCGNLAFLVLVQSISTGMGNELNPLSAEWQVNLARKFDLFIDLDPTVEGT